MTNAILKEEILKDEQLEQVAGGTFRDSRKDLKFMQTVFSVRTTKRNSIP